MSDKKEPIQPVSGTVVPRYAGPSTFARLPELRDVEECDVAIIGVPFDAGTSYRPGARFGPQSVRQASRQLRTNYHPNYDVFDIDEAIKQIEKGSTELLQKVGSIVTIGGDHTIALPLLRSINKKVGGPVALVHFDAHLDTWDTYFGAPYTHGTPFRRAREEKLFLDDASMHIGIRGPLYSTNDLKNDRELGFKTIHCDEFQTNTIDQIVKRIKDRIGNNPLYISIDIDVLDPAHAPGTGTPEVAGMTTREILNVLRGLAGSQLVSADVVEVAPAYDHAELTSTAAATIVYELINIIARNPK